MAIYVKKKLVSSSVDKFIINGKESLLSLVNRSGLPEQLHDYLQVSIDGIVITKEEWEATNANSNNIVFISLVPQGGGDGKNPLAMIAMIALTVFAPQLGLALAGQTAATATWVASAYSAGIMFVGALAINALFPPSLPAVPQGDDTAAFQGFSGLQNSSRPNAAVRNIYGTYRVAPDIAVEPYILTSGDVQSIHAIYDFGYGIVDVSEIKIGNTSIDNFTETNYLVHQGYTNEDLTYYKNDNVSESFNVEIREDYIIKSFPSDSSDYGYIDIQFPIGLAQFHNGAEMNKMPAKFEIQIQETGTSGNEENGWISFNDIDPETIYTSHDVIFSEISDIAKNFNFLDLYDEFNEGASDGSGYSVLRSDSTYNVKTRSETWAVVVYNDGLPYSPIIQNATEIVVDQTFVLNGITYTITSVVENATYNEVVCYTSSEDRNSHTDTCIEYKGWTITIDKVIPADATQIPNKDIFDYEIDLGDSGSTFKYYKYVPQNSDRWNTLISQLESSFTLRRATSKPFTFSMGIPFPYTGNWEVQVKRVRHNQLEVPMYDTYLGHKDTMSDKSSLVAMQSVTLTKPLNFKTQHTILELKIRATDKLSGMVDTLTAMCSRKLYVYEGNSFKQEPEVTSNPAWIALDILRGPANPDPIPDERIDLAMYSQWGEFCQEAITPTIGSKFKADCNWDAMSTVFERLQQVWSAGRATYASIENKHSVIWERFPDVASQLFTPHNSWNFKGSKTFTKKPHGLNVGYIDPQSEWQKVQTIVYNDGYHAVDGEINGEPVEAATYFENIDLPLCTRYSQAWRDGRYYLAQGQLRPESFTIDTDLENLACQRGDMVRVQYDSASMGGTASRVIAINGLEVVLRDAMPTMELLDDEGQPLVYKLRMRYNDNSQDEIIVDSQPQPNSVLLAENPEFLNIGDLVVFGKQNLTTAEFLIKSVTSGPDLSATLSLIPIAREIDGFDIWTDIPDYEPLITNEDMLNPVCLSGVSAQSNLYYDGRYPYIDVDVNWTSVGTNVLYEIWFSEDGTDNYTLVETTSNRNTYKLIQHKSTLDKDYQHLADAYIKVIPVNAFGYKAVKETCEATAFRLVKDTTPPGKPLFLSGNINVDTMNLAWRPPIDPDVGGYVLKFTTEDPPNWDSATPDGSIIPFGTNTHSVNARIGSYMLKTVDTSGNYSDEFALVKTSIPALNGFKRIINIVESDNDFAGSKTNVEVINGGLRLKKLNANYLSSGYYEYESVIDLGNIYNVYISSDTVREVINESNPLIPYSEGDLDVTVQLSVSSNNPVMADWDETYCSVDGCNLAGAVPIGGAGEGDWSGWMNLYAGYYTGRFLKFRALFTSNQTYITPHVPKLNVSIDIVERTYGENDLQCPTEGLDVVYNFPFKEEPSLVISQDNADQGDYFRLLAKSTTGFTIQFYDSAGVPKAADVQFDYIVKGYSVQLQNVSNAIEYNEDDDRSLMNDAIQFYNNNYLFT